MRLPFAFLREFREYTVSRDHADALSFDRVREAQALDVAPELDTHGPGLCLAVECGLPRCVALKADILARHYGGREVA